MQKAGALMLSLLGGRPTKLATAGFTLSPTNAASLSTVLIDDSRDSFYSACLSLVDGIRGLDAGFYTWATVKLYYSVFYALRAMLAADGTCVFYVDHTPFMIQAGAGARVQKRSGRTHQAILAIFEELNPGHRLLSLPIASENALKWLMRRREDSNYRIGRFTEPEAPYHFRKVESLGIRKAIAAYQTDGRSQFLFDPEHAMLAFPLAALTDSGNTLFNSVGVRLSEEELSFLTDECRDSSGPITPLTNFFARIG